MRLRRRCLPSGWYPGSEKGAREAIRTMLHGSGKEHETARAGVVPHAGWEYSGSLSVELFSTISTSIDTIIIIGGHLGASDGILCAFEDAYETPLGNVEADIGLLEALQGSIRIREDLAEDNTVEIQLPLVPYFMPGVKVLGMRASPSEDAVVLGKTLFRISGSLGRKIAVVGSTDLTHYGANYGFSPMGRGEGALKWVREVNDRRFLDSLLALDTTGMIEKSRKERSACSAGGAIAAASYAAAAGFTKSRLLRYATSYETVPSDSFVGYAAVAFS